jgi:cytoskeletal protein RodZ
MNIPGKIASSTLILIGFAWLVSLFFNPRTWNTRSANQVNPTVNGVTSQNFSATKGNVPLADGTQATIDQGTQSTQSTQQQRVQQVPQTINSPNQAATPTPTVTPTVAATPQPTFEPTPAPTPQPKVVGEPVRAGW